MRSETVSPIPFRTVRRVRRLFARRGRVLLGCSALVVGLAGCQVVDGTGGLVVTTTTSSAGLASASVFLPGGGACEVTVEAINTGSDPFLWGQVLGVNGAPTGTWMYLSGDSNAAETGFIVPAGGWAPAPVGEPGDTLDTGAASEGSSGVYWAIWCGGSQSAPHATGEF